MELLFRWKAKLPFPVLHAVAVVVVLAAAVAVLVLVLLVVLGLGAEQLLAQPDQTSQYQRPCCWCSDGHSSLEPDHRLRLRVSRQHLE